jgi:hypothetical protein
MYTLRGLSPPANYADRATAAYWHTLQGANVIKISGHYVYSMWGDAKIAQHLLNRRDVPLCCSSEASSSDLPRIQQSSLPAFFCQSENMRCFEAKLSGTQPGFGARFKWRLTGELFEDSAGISQGGGGGNVNRYYGNTDFKATLGSIKLYCSLFHERQLYEGCNTITEPLSPTGTTT